MREPAWKKLVEDLKESGHESVYLDRLRERLDASRSQDELKREILREMASALGRSEEKVNLALLRLELLDAEIRALAQAAGGGEGRTEQLNARIDAFNDQRRVALRCRWELAVHREALGLRRNKVLDELYPVPPPKRRCVEASQRSEAVLPITSPKRRRWTLSCSASSRNSVRTLGSSKARASRR